MATLTAISAPSVATPGSLAAPDCDPWSSLAWTNLWWRCLDQRRRLVPLTLPGSPRLVLPLVASSWRGLRRLQGAGSDSQRRDLACPPAAWPELAAHLVAAGGWDWLDLNLMPEATAHGWGRALAEHGCRVAITASGRQRYLPLHRPWPLVEQDWTAALRHRLPREERALLRRGAHLETVIAPAAVAAAFERCLAVEASGWKGRQGTAMLSRPAVADFYRQLVRQLAEQQCLRLFLLRCVDEVVAFDLTVVTPRGLAGLKIGMAESWKKWTPGMVLQLWVLRAAHAGGWGEYDFLGGDDPHKAEWTPHFRALCRLQAFAPTWRGRALALGRERRQRWRSQPHLQPV
ncbi:MAG: GNAT family N-acetyltransferase [Terriglobales bacterium]